MRAMVGWLEVRVSHSAPSRWLPALAASFHPPHSQSLQFTGYVFQPFPPQPTLSPTSTWEAVSDTPCFIPKLCFFTRDPNLHILIPAWPPSPCSWWLVSFLFCKSVFDLSNNAWQSAWHRVYAQYVCVERIYSTNTYEFTPQTFPETILQSVEDSKNLK